MSRRTAVGVLVLHDLARVRGLAARAAALHPAGAARRAGRAADRVRRPAVAEKVVVATVVRRAAGILEPVDAVGAALIARQRAGGAAHELAGSVLLAVAAAVAIGLVAVLVVPGLRIPCTPFASDAKAARNTGAAAMRTACAAQSEGQVKSQRILPQRSTARNGHDPQRGMGRHHRVMEAEGVTVCKILLLAPLHGDGVPPTGGMPVRPVHTCCGVSGRATARAAAVVIHVCQATFTGGAVWADKPCTNTNA